MQASWVDPAADKDSSLFDRVKDGRYGSVVQGGNSLGVPITIGTAGVVNTSMLGVKSYDYGKIN